MNRGDTVTKEEIESRLEERHKKHKRKCIADALWFLLLIISTVTGRVLARNFGIGAVLCGGIPAVVFVYSAYELFLTFKSDDYMPKTKPALGMLISAGIWILLKMIL